MSRDLSDGVPAGELREAGMIAGHVGEDEIVLVRDGERVHAIGAFCTHYHGPLAEGAVIDGTIRCPWHHACFDLRSGAVLRAPAIGGLPVWSVEERDGVTSLPRKSRRDHRPRPPVPIRPGPCAVRFSVSSAPLR